MDLQSRGGGTLVELHEHERRRFLETWDRFEAVQAPIARV
jgi:hypothetical protein